MAIRRGVAQQPIGKGKIGAKEEGRLKKTKICLEIVELTPLRINTKV